MPTSRRRSYSPNRYQTVRVSDIPVNIELTHLTNLFSSFGHVRGARIVDSDGTRLGYIDLETDDIGHTLDSLKGKGWQASVADSLDCDSPLIWSGFFSRNRTKRVGVDAYLINGDISIDHKQFHIDIPYRVPIPNKSMYTVKALLIFEAENCTQVEKFREYVKYFSYKERAGYASLSAADDLFLLPPCPEAFELAPNLGSNQMLGLVVSKQNIILNN